MLRRFFLFLFFLIFVYLIKELFRKQPKKSYSVTGNPDKKDVKSSIKEEDIIEVPYKEIKDRK